MKLKVARSSGNLEKIKNFYTQIIGLKILGEFINHTGYDGVFLGSENEGWHLEFAVSEEKPIHIFDEDDALVFYKRSKEEFLLFTYQLKERGIQSIQTKNSYGNENGFVFRDPDGFIIIISYEK